MSKFALLLGQYQSNYFASYHYAPLLNENLGQDSSPGVSITGMQKIWGMKKNSEKKKKFWTSAGWNGFWKPPRGIVFSISPLPLWPCPPPKIHQVESKTCSSN
jgi:hypothetical protein